MIIGEIAIAGTRLQSTLDAVFHSLFHSTSLYEAYVTRFTWVPN
ncbi:hypothetical protein [Acidicapsa acidisoli]|nr:hypothetical protein [Acidicapsa acidisoli]